MKIKLMFEYEGNPIVTSMGEEFRENCIDHIQLWTGDADSVLATLTWDTYDDRFFKGNWIVSSWKPILEKDGSECVDVDLADMKTVLQDTTSVIAVIRNDADKTFKPVGKLSIFLENGASYTFDMEAEEGFGY